VAYLVGRLFVPYSLILMGLRFVDLVDFVFELLSPLEQSCNLCLKFSLPFLEFLRIGFLLFPSLLQFLLAISKRADDPIVSFSIEDRHFHCLSILGCSEVALQLQAGGEL